jgi:hypothetical protein
MTNAPDTRTTHVIRIVGTNDNGDVLQDMWADVERIDIAKSATQTLDGGWQGHQRKHKWMDDPTADDYSPDGNPARTTEIVKVCDPSEVDVNNPVEWIPIPVIKFMKSKGYDGDNNTGTQSQFHTGMDDDEDPTTRIVEVRKISHYDTNIDDDAQAAFDADTTLTAYVVQGSDYQRDDTTKDDSQFVDHEIITYLKHRYNQTNTDDGGVDVGLQTKLLNQYQIDESDPGDGTVVGDSGINPPYRLDPWQNIINVQLSPSQDAVLGLVSLPVTDFTSSFTLISNDGLSWETGFGTSSNAATGLGYTVVCSGQKYVAFGKPSGKKSDGTPADPCFITAKDTVMQRGVLNSSGDLEWATIGTLPAGSAVIQTGAQSCSFAGGLFFVSYSTDSDAATATYLAVFDGISFSTGIRPFNGVSGVASGSGSPGGDPFPIGGNVAYDKKNQVYVTTGTYSRNYIGQFTDGGGADFDASFIDLNFMSSVSVDGNNWTPTFDTSEGSGVNASINGAHAIGGSESGAASNVCFGNGIFVAATGYKVLFRFVVGGNQESVAVQACAVATSTDGRNWTNQRLPGSIALADVGISNSGNSFCAGFFKAKTSSGTPGFFVAAGLEFFESSSTFQSKIWRSDDGLSWTLARTDAAELDWILSAINKSRGKVVFQ